MFNLANSEYQVCNLFRELKINNPELSQAQHSRPVIPNRGFRGTLGYREHFLGVPRDVEIINVL